MILIERLGAQRALLMLAPLAVAACDRNPLPPEGTEVDVEVEVELPDTGWQALALGAGHGCGITADRMAACWGVNTSGQLGAPLDGPEVCAAGGYEQACSPEPLIVEGAPLLVEIAVTNYYSCGLTEAGAVYCWGGGSPEVREIAISGRAIQLAAEWSRLCAALDRGTVTCWEQRDDTTGYAASPLDDPAPRSISGPEPFRSIHLGRTHLCALGESGTAYCWGDGPKGQLGIRDIDSIDEPTPISGQLRFASLSAGAGYTCGITVATETYCWGDNEHAQLGTATPMTCMQDTYYPIYCPSPVPVRAAGEQHLRSVSAGLQHTCGHDPQGQAFCWGDNYHTQLGTEEVDDRCGAWKGTPGGHPCSVSPVLVDQTLRFGWIDVGSSFSCAIADSGDAYCWGSNFGGRLGTRDVPVDDWTAHPHQLAPPSER